MVGEVGRVMVKVRRLRTPAAFVTDLTLRASGLHGEADRVLSLDDEKARRIGSAGGFGPRIDALARMLEREGFPVRGRNAEIQRRLADMLGEGEEVPTLRAIQKRRKAKANT